MKKLFLLLSVLLLSAAFTACGSEEQDPYLVGIWLWDTDSFYHYNFHEDGTGERVFPEFTETFTWSTNGDRLTINRDTPGYNEIENERWTYLIENGTLTIDSQHEEGIQWIYFAQNTEHHPDLTGTWSWALDESYTIILNENGTGTRGPANEAITWASSALTLQIYSPNRTHGRRGEVWAFTIGEDTLTLESLQEEDIITDYFRVN